MERDGCLPRPRPPLDQEHPAQGGPDDLVLFPLDGPRRCRSSFRTGPGRARRAGRRARRGEGRPAISSPPGRTPSPVPAGARDPPRRRRPAGPGGRGEPLVLHPDHPRGPRGPGGGEARGPGGPARWPGRTARRWGPPVDDQRLGSALWMASRPMWKRSPPPVVARRQGGGGARAPRAGRSARRSAPGRRCPAAPAGPGWSAPPRRARSGTGTSRPGPRSSTPAIISSASLRMASRRE